VSTREFYNYYIQGKNPVNTGEINLIPPTQKEFREYIHEQGQPQRKGYI